jgi:hypothetical protein
MPAKTKKGQLFREKPSLCAFIETYLLHTVAGQLDVRRSLHGADHLRVADGNRCCVNSIVRLGDHR